jgi:hypothetical protein
MTNETKTRRSRKARVDDRNPFDTPAKLRALSVQKQPRRVSRICRGVSLYHRRNEGDGTWIPRIVIEKGAKPYRTSFGSSTEFNEPDGKTYFSFEQAIEKVKQLASEQTPTDGVVTSAPATVADALRSYEADLKRRGAEVYNAKHPRKHLTSALLRTPVMLLTAKLLSDWRDGLRTTTDLADSSIDRILKGLRAALNAAAAADPARIKNKNAWKIGLETISEEIPARKAVLSDAKVSAFIAEAYAINDAFGEFIDVLAQCGMRPSQAARLTVQDLDDSDPERPQLHCPKSAKGGKRARKARAEQR